MKKHDLIVTETTRKAYCGVDFDVIGTDTTRTYRNSRGQVVCREVTKVRSDRDINGDVIGTTAKTYRLRD